MNPRNAPSSKSAALPRIVIDARMIGSVPHGMARYVTRLASGIAGLRRTYPLAYEPVFLVASDFAAPDFFGFRVVKGGKPFLSSGELFEIPRVLRTEGAAVFHSPSFSSLMTRGPWKPDCPWIITVHDLNHLTYGDWKRKLYYRKILQPFCRKAWALITVSEFSRKEIAEWTGVPEASIEIVHNALEPELIQAPNAEESRAILSKHGLQSGRYFFCLSNPKPHKNIGLLVDAYRDLRTRRGESETWPLVLSMHEFADAPGVLGLGGLQEQEVRVLRAHAGAVAFPSLYEGFGLPPLEAVLCGAPLIVSKIPPHQEGLADLGPSEAVWVDPTDRAGWTNALRLAIDGKVAPAAMETRTKILTRFSEQEMARRMDRIYRRVLLSIQS